MHEFSNKIALRYKYFSLQTCVFDIRCVIFGKILLICSKYIQVVSKLNEKLWEMIEYINKNHMNAYRKMLPGRDEKKNNTEQFFYRTKSWVKRFSRGGGLTMYPWVYSPGFAPIRSISYNPVHNARQIRAYLYRNFRNLWSGVVDQPNAPIPRSTAVTFIDFFRWGTLKVIVYETVCALLTICSILLYSALHMYLSCVLALCLCFFTGCSKIDRLFLKSKNFQMVTAINEIITVMYDVQNFFYCDS